jgi:hypothetical protein
MLINERQKLASILQTSADKLDIPDHVYEDATLKYEDVGEHLAADDSDLRAYKPQIYVQGSFRLGTVVQPYGRGDEYDIDLVCQLEMRKESVTQKDLKARVGDRLREREDLARILEPSRRCWILHYPVEAGMPGFHMDVLPSIPNEERRPTGILLTDTELTRWQKSNPVAYAEWFKKRMEVVFRVRKAALAETMLASVEDVPDWRVKTPLQRCVQILKRHRDIHFERKPEVKPVSIILTTLAAHAYENEEDIFDALTGIASRMPAFIENRNGRWWVQNPVDDGENFADKWNDYPERRAAFMDWLQKVSVDFANVSKAETVADGLIMLDESLGRQTMDKVAAELGVKRASLSPAVVSTASLVPALGNTTHALSPTSQFQLSPVPQYNAKISAGVYFKKGDKKGRFLWPMSDKPVPKSVWLKFTVKTNVPGPYSIRWQVVNTGEEAMRDGEPRGDFYSAEAPDKHIRWESTAYRGTHWVEAFVLNSAGVCVARSGRFFVRVR